MEMLSILRKWETIGILLAASVLVAVMAWSGFAIGIPRGTLGEPIETETRCFGRLLIDVPKGAQTVCDYKLMGSTVQTISGVNRSQYEQRVRSQQTKLLETPHTQGETLFVDRDDISANHVTLISWASAASRRIYDYREYQYLPEQQILYVWLGQGTANAASLESAREAQRRWSNRLQYRDSLEIPSTPGFCITCGFVATDAVHQEEMTVGFVIPGYPKVSVALNSFVTAYDMEARAFEKVDKLKRHGVQIIRNRKKNWQGSPAHELLIKYKVDGVWHYEFEWRASSKAHTAEQPFVSLSLHSDSRPPEDPNPSLAPREPLGQEDLLVIWDRLVSSIRPQVGKGSG